MTMEQPALEGADKTTLGVTEAGRIILEQIMERDDLFNTEAAAFKAVIALAWSLELQVSEVPLPIRTKWAVGGTMSDLVDLVGWYCQSDRPVELANRLADAGLAQVADAIAVGASIDRIFAVQTVNL
ncbi:hypothetical protein [Microbacterium sp. Bi128]|uniref:hypothetical protein n=1 Tax=Microbacterium sp. Bi128 TaxID=2821115 RepID=UPI001E32D1B2|nr:hypothetical protein [Microbacterium sp. Bi128]